MGARHTRDRAALFVGLAAAAWVGTRAWLGPVDDPLVAVVLAFRWNQLVAVGVWPVLAALLLYDDATLSTTRRVARTAFTVGALVASLGLVTPAAACRPDDFCPRVGGIGDAFGWYDPATNTVTYRLSCEYCALRLDTGAVLAGAALLAAGLVVDVAWRLGRGETGTA